MKNFITGIVVAVFAIIVIGFVGLQLYKHNGAGALTEEETPKLEVTTYPGQLTELLAQVTVRSLEDNITIKDVTFNRGNCKLMDNVAKKLKEVGGLKLAFGETFVTLTTCAVGSIRETTITTDRGEVTYTF